ncbi:GNAT family N-acetyltransferase [Neisseria leonii]|uniref:GNAT family N-acetyltransferase n=1 Tax=Neisseria leonii TaxID=2995413 RepID=A0A9X4E3W8_9NEIS|nr:MULTISPECIES: GNAT family N-acetyltransferase [unclassified Neisseria]MDD9325362.1 GNAT family N-acetyltransferase [Neisseria sp. 3986]MDD9328260.1 GNAT family N-acetyltransferase [Neisseria sp. 51.81]
MNPQLLLRIGDEDDIAAIVELLNTCYRGREGWTTEADIIAGERVSAEAVEAMLADRRRYFFVFDNLPGEADTPGSLLGCIVVWLDPAAPERTACVEMAAVHPAIQQQGIGGEMLRQVEDFARRHLRQGWMKMEIVAGREALLAYYRRRGYQATGSERVLRDEENYGCPKNGSIRMIELAKRLDG